MVFKMCLQFLLYCEPFPVFTTYDHGATSFINSPLSDQSDCRSVRSHTISPGLSTGNGVLLARWSWYHFCFSLMSVFKFTTDWLCVLSSLLSFGRLVYSDL